jgi:hypothetical protein
MLTTSTFRFRRLAAGLAAAATAVAMVPAAASATAWFGSSLNHEPANAGASCVSDDTVPPPMCTHVGSYYPGTSGRVKAPFDGTVTALRIRAEGPTTLTFHLVRVRNLSADETTGQAKVVATSRTLQLQGPSSTDLDNGVYPVETFHVHLKVHQGDEVAVDTTNNTAEYCSNGTPGQLTFNPPLQAGAGFRASTGVDDCLLLVQAVEKHAH